MMVVFIVIGWIAWLIQGAWTCAAVCYLIAKTMKKDIPIARWLGTELKPLFLPATVTDLSWRIIWFHMPPWQVAINLTMGLLAWWLYKDVFDDDDRWNRRRKKVKEAIKRIGNRLVPVPAPAES